MNLDKATKEAIERINANTDARVAQAHNELTTLYKASKKRLEILFQDSE